MSRARPSRSGSMGRVRVLFFATAREAVGHPRADRAVPAEGVPLEELLAGLAREFPRLKPVLRVSRIVRNGRYVRPDGVRAKPGDEIAIHPPFSGG